MHKGIRIRKLNGKQRETRTPKKGSSAAQGNSADGAGPQGADDVSMASRANTLMSGIELEEFPDDPDVASGDPMGDPGSDPPQLLGPPIGRARLLSISH